jgi:hypothetical protein
MEIPSTNNQISNKSQFSKFKIPNKGTVYSSSLSIPNFFDIEVRLRNVFILNKGIDL